MVNVIPLSDTSLVATAKKIAWQDYNKYATPQDYLTLYIDVPYCAAECKYCYHNYGGIQLRDHIYDSEIDHLEREMVEAASILGSHPIRAINFGGGTPSLLNPRQLERILQIIDDCWNIDKSDASERGFEGHPIHFTDELISVLSSSYMNRLSLGVQSFDPQVLRHENRQPVSISMLTNIVQKFRASSSIKAINVDLLAGLIDQTPEILENDIWELMQLGLEQITIYKASKTKNHQDHPEIQPDGLWKLLSHVDHIFNRDVSPYLYIGTSNKDNLMKCNRFYLKDVDSFQYAYNPTPWDYNSCIGFTIDRETSNAIQHPWSFFTPANLGYEIPINQDNTFMFYNLITPLDRLHWGDVYSRRADERSKVLAVKFESLKPQMQKLQATLPYPYNHPPYSRG